MNKRIGGERAHLHRSPRFSLPFHWFLQNDGWLSMVAVDDKGNKVEVPKLLPVSQEDVNRQRGAQERRSLRLLEREQLKQTLGIV